MSVFLPPHHVYLIDNVDSIHMEWHIEARFHATGSTLPLVYTQLYV